MQCVMIVPLTLFLSPKGRGKKGRDGLYGFVGRGKVGRALEGCPTNKSGFRIKYGMTGTSRAALNMDRNPTYKKEGNEQSEESTTCNKLENRDSSPVELRMTEHSSLIGEKILCNA